MRSCAYYWIELASLVHNHFFKLARHVVVYISYAESTDIFCSLFITEDY